METQAISKEIITVLSEATMREEREITPDMLLENDLGIDSIMLAGLIAKLHPLLETGSDLNGCIAALLAARTVGDMISIVEHHS